MDKVEWEELCLGTEADVTGRHEVEDTNLSPRWKRQETPKKRDVGINGVVTMETRRKELMRKKEEERWRELYPEIKKCVIVIVRQRLDRLNVKLKQETNTERREEEGGGGQRSDDPEPNSNWTKPLEQDDSDGEFRLRSFVKKVEVTVPTNCTPANGPRKPHGRHRGSGLLRLRQCPDVTLDPVDSAHHRRSLESQSLMERWRRISNNKQMDNDDSINQSDTDHNYSIITKVPPTPDTANNQSQDARHKDGGSRSCSTEKKNPPSIVFKKVGGGQWVLRQSEVKKEEKEEEKEEEEEEDRDSTTITEQMKLWTMENKQTPGQRNKRRSACRKCAACLRQDCGKCIHCLDKRKFGGPEKRKQKCRLRVCLMVETRKNYRQQSLETETEKPVSRQDHWRRQRDENDVMETKEIRAVKRRRRWGGDRVTHRRMKKEAKEEEMKEEKTNTHSAQTDQIQEGLKMSRSLRIFETNQPINHNKEVKSRWTRRRWGRRTAKAEPEEDGNRTKPLEKEEEEEPKKETHPPQLNLTLNGSHFTPSILSDSTLTINSLSGVLPQEASVLHESSLHPLLLQPKEEEEAVEIRKKGENEGRREEEELCNEGVTDGGEYYEMEVEVPGSDSDEETLKSSGSFSLLGDKVSDEVTCGRGLLRLLRVLRKMVLPAHWVPVLVDGPVLQLLQCSRLSSMANTFVHIQPDQRFYITVQNRLLPDTHSLYRTHTQRITHISQLVSLLLELERLVVCRESRVRSCRLDVPSPTCHLLVALPCLTCLPCLLGKEEEETEVEEDVDESWEEVREDELSVSLSPPAL